MQKAHGIKILVVDDDPISLKLLGNALEHMGYRVIFAENGKKAWEIFQEDEIRFVISDWEMPEMDGITLCHKFEITPQAGIAIIYLSRSSRSTVI